MEEETGDSGPIKSERQSSQERERKFSFLFLINLNRVFMRLAFNGHELRFLYFSTYW